MEQLLSMKMLTSRKKVYNGELSSTAAKLLSLKKVKEVMFNLEQAVKAQRGSRGIVLLFI
jgi:hypothetical protein